MVWRYGGCRDCVGYGMYVGWGGGRREPSKSTFEALPRSPILSWPYPNAHSFQRSLTHMIPSPYACHSSRSSTKRTRCVPWVLNREGRGIDEHGSKLVGGEGKWPSIPHP